MVLRNDKKGMASLVDAMIFVTLLSIASISMATFIASECQEEPMAKTVCNDIISIDLKASDVLDTQDSDVYSISDLLASGMNSDRTERIREYIGTTLDQLVPNIYGYDMRISYGDMEMSFVRDVNGAVTSEYSTDVEIINGETVSYNLTISQR